MHRFRAVLVPGRKAPYTTWTFVELPERVAAALGAGGPHAVRGFLAGSAFRATAHRSDGALRVPVTRDLMAAAGVERGEEVEVRLELDPEPRPIELPEELERVLAADPELRDLFARLPPSMRRAWAAHVGDAKKPETRHRRAAKAPDGIRARGWPR